MADLARALQTPVPGQQPAATSRTPAGPEPRPFGIQQEDVRASNKAKKNERDRLRRKAQRAAALKAAETPKKKKAKKKAAAVRKARAQADAMSLPTKKKRRRGRPPGAKNKPKVGLAVALVPAPGVLPRGRSTKVASADSLLTQINLAVTLLNAMPEHARKVVLDAVK